MAELIDVQLVTNDEPSLATRDQLIRLLATFDLEPWLYTRVVAIDSRAIPHSHPTLTLHTRHVGDDRLLLATFLHEQLHWFLMSRPDANVEAAFADLQVAFADAPVAPPDGAADRESTYLHLIVNYLEADALTTVLGAASAREVIEFWASDHYRWVYRMVLERGDEIRGILERYELLDSAIAV